MTSLPICLKNRFAAAFVAVTSYALSCGALVSNLGEIQAPLEKCQALEMKGKRNGGKGKNSLGRFTENINTQSDVNSDQSEKEEKVVDPENGVLPGIGSGSQLSKTDRIQDLKVIVFDFDKTISAAHAWGKLADNGKWQELVQLGKLVAAEKNEGGLAQRPNEHWVKLLGGSIGKNKILLLKAFFSVLASKKNVRLHVASKGLISTARYILDKAGLLQYFGSDGRVPKVFGSISNVKYSGEMLKEFNEKSQGSFVLDGYQGLEEKEHMQYLNHFEGQYRRKQESDSIFGDFHGQPTGSPIWLEECRCCIHKPQTVQRIAAMYGGCDVSSRKDMKKYMMLVEDDGYEAQKAREEGLMPVHVKGKAGIEFPEMMRILKWAGSSKQELMAEVQRLRKVL